MVKINKFIFQLSGYISDLPTNLSTLKQAHSNLPENFQESFRVIISVEIGLPVGEYIDMSRVLSP